MQLLLRSQVASNFKFWTPLRELRGRENAFLSPEHPCNLVFASSGKVLEKCFNVGTNPDHVKTISRFHLACLFSGVTPD